MACRRDYIRLTGETNGAALLFSEQSIFYFTGFLTSARRPKQIGFTAVWMTAEVTCLVYPKTWEMQVEEMQLRQECKLLSYQGGVNGFYKEIRRLVGQERTGHLWIEYDSMPYSLCQEIESVPFKDITPFLWDMRMVKDLDEINALRRSAGVAVSAMEHARRILKPGMTELEVVAEVEYHMRRNGSEGTPFMVKSLTGVRSSVVTRVPQAVRIQEGDLLLLDFGATVNGYASDWTRTFCIGRPTGIQQELYGLVWEIERACIHMTGPGVSYKELTDCMQEAAGRHPFGEYLNPHLGHSVGIGSHEPVVIEPGAKGKLRPGMVITIEPGIYLPGIGGVRIENEVLVKEDGIELLTGLEEETLEI